MVFVNVLYVGLSDVDGVIEGVKLILIGGVFVIVVGELLLSEKYGLDVEGVWMFIMY